MSNLVQFLESLKTEIVTSQFSYVYYTKEDGKIIKISSKSIPDENYEILTVPHDSVKDILEGNKKMEDFIIAYDMSAKQLAPQEITYESDLEIVQNKLFELPVIRTSGELSSDKKPLSFELIYDGIDVLVFDPKENFYKDQIVWYKNNVYKLLTDIPADSILDESNCVLYIENVKLTDVESTHKITRHSKILEEQYVGVYVDVWYNELEHLEGQHIWFENTVYRLNRDIPKNTPFSKSFGDVLVENVKLLRDFNESLDFAINVVEGDIVLNYNRLYLINVDQNTESTSNNCVYYTGNNKIIFYDVEHSQFVKVEIMSLEGLDESELQPFSINYEITSVYDLVLGDTVLIGKNLYNTNNVENNLTDITIVQNNTLQCWQVILNKRTKQKLLEYTFRHKDTLYFSITAKHDPNILYRYVTFYMKDLLSKDYVIIPYQFEWEFNDKEVSIYTPRYFDSYTHEIVG